METIDWALKTIMNMHICNAFKLYGTILLANVLGLNEFMFVLQMQLLAAVLSMARELDPSYWTMWPALDQNLDFMTVVAMELVFITVPTLKMLVPVVRFNVSDI